MYNKSIIIIVFLVLLFVAFYILLTINIFDNYRQKVYSQDKNFVLLVSYKDPKMAYGSGHKVLYLYNKFYIYLGKITYGEHPLEIKSWIGDDIEILVKVQNRDQGTIGYILNWLKPNKKIGGNTINYHIVTPNRDIYIQ